MAASPSSYKPVELSWIVTPSQDYPRLGPFPWQTWVEDGKPSFNLADRQILIPKLDISPSVDVLLILKVDLLESSRKRSFERYGGGRRDSHAAGLCSNEE